MVSIDNPVQTYPDPDPDLDRDPSRWPRSNLDGTFYNELSRGHAHGFDWHTAHNDLGFRVGYVNIKYKHPWANHEIGSKVLSNIDVHGGITYSEKYAPQRAQRFSYQWYIGFDCGHADDAPDITILPVKTVSAWALCDQMLARVTSDTLMSQSIFELLSRDGVVRDQQYVEQQCIYLCKQAANA